MPMLNPTTELEAVNEMLMSIGQAPVSTLAVSGIRDVNLARSLLASQTRKVSLRRFNWNSDESYPLTPDADGVILIPNGALDVEPTDSTVNAVIRRHPTKGMALWDKDARGWTFAAPLDADVIWGFPFEDLPEIARSYIHISAGRLFQKRVIGSQILDRFEQEDEDAAWAQLIKTELRSRDSNLFRQNASVAKLLNRSY